MPAKKQQPSEDLDSFLDDFEVASDPAETVEDIAPEEFQTSFEEDFEPLEDEEDAELARLRAELAAPVVVPKRATVRPKPESQLTEKEKEIRHLQDELARKKAAAIENAEAAYDEEDGDTYIIHFVDDGFTAFGQVWYRGQELEFHVGGADEDETRDINGKSWLDQNDERQLARYGKIMFRKGPWPGKKLSSSEISATERQRARRVPLI